MNLSVLAPATSKHIHFLLVFSWFSLVSLGFSGFLLVSL